MRQVEPIVRISWLPRPELSRAPKDCSTHGTKHFICVKILSPAPQDTALEASKKPLGAKKSKCVTNRFVRFVKHNQPNLPSIVGLPCIACMTTNPVPANSEDCPVRIFAEVVCEEVMLKMLGKA